MDLGLLYQALQNNQIDVAVGNSTDGLISALSLVVLEDDRHYFPPYDAAVVVRSATLEEHPEVRQALDALGGRLSESEMREINYRIDGQQASVSDVVREWRARVGL
jgi:glycine betaine/choline ABC-type transport system substrate-binding protein